MIRFLIDKFRQAPGPLKQVRLIASDLAEEVVDLAEHYLKGRTDFTETIDDFSGAPTGDVAQAREAAPKPKPAPRGKPREEASESLPVDAELRGAIESPGNKRKQEFKVLAILWDTRKREMGPMSAKAISQHGEKIGLKIRHENVRKVIRMRLEKFIKVHTEGVGNGTIYRYELDTPGVQHFESTYFQPR